MFKKVFKIFVTFIISAIVSGENTATYMIRDSNKLDGSLFLSVLVDIIDFPIKSTIRRIKTGLKFNINLKYCARNSMELEWHLCFQVLSCLQFQMSKEQSLIFYCFETEKLQNRPKNLGLSSQLSTYLFGIQSYYCCIVASFNARY